MIFRAILLFAVFLVPSLAWAQGSDSRLTAKGLSDSFAAVIRSAAPAVVSIEVRGRAPEVQIRGNDREDTFDDLVRRRPQPRTNVGSGFIFEETGFIVTNSHVIEDASKIFVRLADGSEFVARIVGADDETDLAVIKIDAGRALPTLRFANSDSARVGDWVLAFGSPFGLAKTVTAGIISETKRETPFGTARPFQRFIQTDAAINRGNSGGPLVDLNGEVIGVNSQIATTSGESNGIGFALPANEASRVARQLAESGKVRRGYLGVGLESVRAEFAAVYCLPDAAGAVVTSVTDKKSAAAVAGLEPGDVILELGGAKIIDAADLVGRVAAVEPGTAVELTIARESSNGLERKTLPVKLGERPSNVRESPNPDRRVLPVGGGPIPANPFGLNLSAPSAEDIIAFKLAPRKGVVVKSIDAASLVNDLRMPNGDPALREGEIILRLNRAEINDPESFKAATAKLRPGSPVVIHLLTLNAQRSVILKIVQFTMKQL